MSRPTLLAVDEDEKSLHDIERELSDRYERSYRIVALGSASEAGAELARLADTGEEVALVLAGELRNGASGSEFLGGVRKRHPPAQRGLLIDYAAWGDGPTGEAIFAAMARRQIDYYLIRPTRAPDEMFHQAISTFLLEWAHERRLSSHTVHIVGESWTGRAHELREVLGRCASPMLSASPTRPKGARWSPGPAAGSRCHWSYSPTGSPRRSEQRRTHDRCGWPGEPGRPRLRPGDRRWRAGRALGCGLRRLRRVPHPGDRQRRYRRTSDPEFADP